MDLDVERSIRNKILDIQIFLSSPGCRDGDRARLDRELDGVMKVIEDARNRGSEGELP